MVGYFYLAAYLDVHCTLYTVHPSEQWYKLCKKKPQKRFFKTTLMQAELALGAWGLMTYIFRGNS